MNFCHYLKSFCDQTSVTDSSNLEKFAPTEKVDQKINTISNSRDDTRSKSFFEKTKIKIKWSLRPLRNLILGSNLHQRLYIIGWFFFFLAVLLALIIYAPFIFVILISIASGFTIVKYRKEISNWITLAKFLRILSALLIIIEGKLGLNSFSLKQGEHWGLVYYL